MYNLGRVTAWVPRTCYYGVLKVSGMCLEGVWNVSGMCLEAVWNVSEMSLEGVSNLSVTLMTHTNPTNLN